MARVAGVVLLAIGLALAGSGTARAATPTITGFTPASGPAGTVVTITGTALTGATRVTIGGVPSLYSVLGPTHIRTVVPAASHGGPVAVTTPGGSTESRTAFALSTGASAFPKTAPPGGLITITGSGMPAGGPFDVEIDGRILRSAIANAAGGFQLTGVQIPFDETLGNHLIDLVTQTGFGINFPILLQGDWPQDRSEPSGIGTNALELTLGTGNVAGLKQKWSIIASAPVGLSPPVVVGNVLTAGAGDGRVYSINTITSKGWSVKPGNQINGSPAVVGGIIYIGDGFSMDALDAQTGATIWHVDTSGTVGSSPAVGNGVVYFTGWNGTGNAVWALNAKTGAVKWSTQLDTGGSSPGLIGSPAVDANNVYVGDDTGAVYALDRTTGNVAWSKAPGGRIEGTPAVSGGTVWFSTLGNAGVWVRSYDTATGAKNWAVIASAFGAYSSPAFHAGKVFAVTGNGVVALHASDGTVAWSYGSSASLDDTAPAVANGVVYAVVGGEMVALNENTGAQLFTTTGSYTGPISSPVVADGRVFFGDHDGVIHAFGP
jgi:outer membrane protein assembly factor BamB